MSEIAKMLIRRTIKDKQLAEQMVPDYNIFCKRVLVLDGYYEASNLSWIVLVFFALAVVVAL